MSSDSFTSTANCPLCLSKSNWFCEYFENPINFYKCSNCYSIFKESQSYLDSKSEKERYNLHENDVHDQDYQNFVSPITNTIISNFDIDCRGLDFGCGPGPVIAHVLKKSGYRIELFDPFYFPNPSIKKQKFDFIICCEVMEHFHLPSKEFKFLKSLINSNGRLYCKTQLISNTICVDDFKNWYYKNDPTHVFFYSPIALEYIKAKEGFQFLDFDEKLITFKA